MTEPLQTKADEDQAGASSIRWPPPGLERLQGDLVRVAIRAALGGGILVVPLLFVLGRDQELATLGPFADAWWVTLVLAIIGLAFAADSLVRAMMLMRRASRAIERGYDAGTVRMVIADGSRDMGFLITGSRHFSRMDAREREAIASLRFFSVSLYALAGIWLPNALAVCILLGARALISPSTLWMVTALPALGLYAFGCVAGTVAQSRVRRARRRWFGQPWVEDLASDQARSWRASVAGREGMTTQGVEGSSLGPALRLGSIVMAVLAAVVAVPILTLVPTGAMGPILTEIGMPRFDNVGSRAARAEAMRSYRVTVDASVSPADAGQLLYDLTYAGTSREPLPGERAPSRRIPTPWLPEGMDESNPMGIHPFEWPDSLFTLVARGLSEEQASFLDEVSAHPARADLSRLAHAGAIDIAGARYETPFPEGLNLAQVPIPNYLGFFDAVYSHVAAAASELANGRGDRAQTLVAEIVSLGFLLGDGGPTLMDNLVGFSLIERGATAMADLFAATGQAEEAVRLSDLRAAADGAASRARFVYPEGAEAWVRALPSIVSDSTVARGVRWEMFIAVTTLTPCINLQRLVFGPDQEYWDFVNEAYEHLVEWPSEDGLFELARSGWFGSNPGGASLLGRLLSTSMRTGEGTCGEVVRQLDTQEAVFGPWRPWKRSRRAGRFVSSRRRR